MRWLLILICLMVHQTSFSQENPKGIQSRSDKKIYSIGDQVTILTKSKEEFSISTDGSCSASPIAPVLIKEKDGKFELPFIGPKMCCGLPYTQPMKKYDSLFDLIEVGRYRVVLFTNRGMVYSNIFEVK